MDSSGLRQIVRVIDGTRDCPELPLIMGSGTCKAVLWPGNGAGCRTFHLFQLAAGDRTVDLQHQSDSVYYVIGGIGTVTDLRLRDVRDLSEGVMLHIDKGDRYRFAASDTEELKLIGGPCPADPSLYTYIASARTD